jgi:hypothetical protein
MFDQSTRRLPISLEDPETVRTGELFVADLEAVGPWETDLRTLARAVCTLGTRFRDFDLTHVVLADRHTAVWKYHDEKQYQVEFIFDDNSVRDTTIQKLEDYVQYDTWGLVVIVDGSIMHNACEYCESNANVDLVSLDSATPNRTGPW